LVNRVFNTLIATTFALSALLYPLFAFLLICRCITPIHVDSNVLTLVFYVSLIIAAVSGSFNDTSPLFQLIKGVALFFLVVYAYVGSVMYISNTTRANALFIPPFLVVKSATIRSTQYYVVDVVFPLVVNTGLVVYTAWHLINSRTRSTHRAESPASPSESEAETYLSAQTFR